MSTEQRAQVEALLRQAAFPVDSDVNDGVRLARQAAADDVEVTLDITAKAPHVFQAFHPFLDEAAAALDSAGQFLSAHLRADEFVAG